MPPNVTRLPEATREAQMDRWGIAPDRTGDLDFPLRRVRTNENREARSLLQSGGFIVCHPGGGTGGTVAHRGLTHPDEYVDEVALRAAVCERLGFTAVEIRSVYRQGPMTPASRALRDRIDLRLLEVYEAGGVMIELARALGWAVRANGSCRTLENALGRARARRAVAA